MPCTSGATEASMTDRKRGTVSLAVPLIVVDGNLEGAADGRDGALRTDEHPVRTDHGNRESMGGEKILNRSNVVGARRILRLPVGVAEPFPIAG